MAVRHMGRAAFTRQLANTSIATTRRGVNGAVPGLMARVVSIRPRVSTATVLALISAFGAALHPMALAASTAPPASTRSEKAGYG